MAAAVAPSHDFGAESLSRLEPSEPPRYDQVADELQQLVLSCNKEGMEFLRKGQYKQAFEQLKYAEAVLDTQGLGENDPSSMLAVTCNNLGCYYKKVGKLHAALSYLRKALKVELSLQTDDATVAGTHLNVCAILSKLDKHDKAVKHAECALQLVSSRHGVVGEHASAEENQLLAIAYHNVAVEQDYLHQWDAAADAYQQGFQVAKTCLGEQHPLTQTLGKHCETAVQKSQKFTHRPAPASPPPAVSEGRSRAMAAARTVAADVGLPHASVEAAKRTPSPAPGAEGPSPLLPDIGGGSNLRITKDFTPQRGGDGLAAGRSVLPGTAGALGSPGSAAAARQDAVDWVQSEESRQWRTPAAANQLPPMAQPSSVPGPAPLPPPMAAYGRFGAGAFTATPPLADLGFPAEPTWKLETTSQVMGSSFMDRLVQDAPAAGHFASKSSEPPPLVYIAGAGASKAASSRQMRQQLKAREAQQQPQHSAEALMPLEDASTAVEERARRTNYVPVPPSTGRPGRPVRPGGGALARRIQREMGGKASGRPPAPGTLEADQAPAGGLPGGLRPQQSQLLRNSAAEKIQRNWRESYRRRTQVVRGHAREQHAAIKIQARWRGFAVVRRRHNKAVTEMQRWTRGFLVRRKKQRLQAAIRIERHARGMLGRRKLAMWAATATRIQTMVRRKLAQLRVQARRKNFKESALLLQCAWRRKQAYLVAADRRGQRQVVEARHEAATRIQRVLYRGRKGRARFSKAKREHEAIEAQHAAASKLEALARARFARKEVGELRRVQREKVDFAATTIRKHWLRYFYRKRLLDLKQGFSLHTKSIVLIQRYARGFVVRSKMWKDAIRAEEELWAAVELQRCWRGFAGRLRWAREFEYTTSRDRAAKRLQRAIRGWVARTRLKRMRQRRARIEFERSRMRFNAAQRIQAVMRGVQCRARICAFLRRKRDSAVKIQSVFRGHRLRASLWEKLVDKRTAQIQAAMRGFLVRNRRFHLLVRIVCIQSNYRKWLRWMPEEERRRRCEAWRARRAEARAAAAAEAAAEL